MRETAAGAILAAWCGVAQAGGATRKVDVETDPPGAAVYLNDVDEGAACEKTPCTIDAPLGTTPIIIRLDRFEPIIDQLDIPKKARKPLVVRFKLRSAIGTLVIDSPGSKGASVKIDDVDRGKVPARLEVDTEGHHVVVTLNGKTLYDDIVEVEAGGEVPIAPKSAGGGGGVKSPPHGDRDGDDGGDGKVVIHKTAPSKPRERFITGGIAFDVGARHFVYQNAVNGPSLAQLSTEDETGQAILGPAIELWPAELLHARQLRGLSVFLRIEFPINHQAVTDKGGEAIGPAAFWGSIEASIRHRWTLADMVGLEVSGGFVRDQFAFSGMTTDVAKVPDADYKSLRLGVRASLAGPVEPYLAAEGRFVLSGGDVGTRFDTASATGLRAALGVAAHAGPLSARLEASLLEYTWSFTYDMQNDVAEATGATDRVLMLSALVGYTY